MAFSNLRTLPSQERLVQLLDYDPATGLLRWKKRPASDFGSGTRSSQQRANIWNSRFAGAEAFTSAHSAGYKTGGIDGRIFLAQRVIWKLVTGEEPEQIDHRDGDRANNRWLNLRATDHSGNMQNFPLRVDNTTGATGVYQCSRYGKWRAQIGGGKSRQHLGSFDTFEEALAAREQAVADRAYLRGHRRAA